MRINPVVNVATSTRSSQTIPMMVMLERPPAEDNKHDSRSDKYRALLNRAQRQRAQLIDWIVQNGLADECVNVKEPTAFNVLFLEGTPVLAEALRKAPNVVCVALVGDLMLELLDKPHHG